MAAPFDLVLQILASYSNAAASEHSCTQRSTNALASRFHSGRALLGYDQMLSLVLRKQPTALNFQTWTARVPALLAGILQTT